MLDSDFRLTAVEVVHHAGADVRRTDSQPWRPSVDDREVHQLGERFAERHGRIKTSAIHPQRDVCAPECWQIGLEESGNATGKCRPVRPRVGDSRPRRHERPCVWTLHPLPELVERGEAVLRLIACDDARVDSTYRGTDDPIRFHSRLVQRLIYANLVGAQGSTALKDQNDLPVRLSAKFIDRVLNHCFGHVAHRSLHWVGNCLKRSVPGRIWPALSRFQCAVQPPSTGNAMPVIEAAAPEARKTESAPSSSTVAKRLLGCCASSTSRITFSRGMLCAFACPSICASTSGV